MAEERIDAMPLFSELEDEQRGQVAGWMREVTVEEGTMLAVEGDFSYEFFVIEEGTPEVRQKNLAVAELRAGDFFGEVGLLVTGRRTASVVATAPMWLAAMFTQEFRQMEAAMRAVAEASRSALRERGSRAFK